jgi:hypothetical protein
MAKVAFQTAGQSGDFAMKRISESAFLALPEQQKNDPAILWVIYPD